MSRESDVSGQEIANFLMEPLRTAAAESNAGRSQNLALALHTRDAIDLVAMEIYALFAKRILGRLRSIDPGVELFDNRGEIDEPANAVGWRSSKWGRGISVCLEFDRRRLVEPYIGICAPTVQALREWEGESGIFDPVDPAQYQAMRDAVETGQMFDGLKNYVTPWWPCSFLLSDFMDGTSTETLLQFAGHTPYRGMTLDDWFIRDVERLYKVMLKVLG